MRWPTRKEFACGGGVQRRARNGQEGDDVIVWKEHGVYHIRRAFSPFGRLWVTVQTLEEAKREFRKLRDYGKPIFEIYENGDPYSRSWDCTEYKEESDLNGGVGVYRGDLNGRDGRKRLIARLRTMYRGCRITNRSSGRTL